MSESLLKTWQASIEKRLAVIERYHGIRHREELPVPAAATVRPELVGMRDTLRTEFDQALDSALRVEAQAVQDPRKSYRAAVAAWRRLSVFCDEAAEATGDTSAFGASTLPKSPEELPMFTSVKLRTGPVLGEIDRTSWAHLLKNPALVR
jgi:hypothetical protein